MNERDVPDSLTLRRAQATKFETLYNDNHSNLTLLFQSTVNKPGLSTEWISSPIIPVKWEVRSRRDYG
ncbi:hypothetical protein E4U58_001109 [Claviceps cyperi]|nr:hypothetical protein E4U58_001109 [Claviceps cyperi]